MIIKQYVLGPISANNYLVMDEKSKEAVLIDCSEKSQKLLDDIKNLNAQVKYILLTHGHFDHVMGVNDMKKELGAKVLIHKKDVSQMDMTKSIIATFGFSIDENPSYDEFVDENSDLSIGDIKIKVIPTPGHTEGGVCYLVDGKLFSGDTLFRDYVGRTDLPGGSFESLKTSIKDVLFKLDDNTEVFPGHNEMTTIGYEKKYNEII